MFKKLVARALEVKTQQDVDTLCGDVSRLFGAEKIKYDEYELIFRILDKVWTY